MIADNPGGLVDSVTISPPAVWRPDGGGGSARGDAPVVTCKSESVYNSAMSEYPIPQPGRYRHYKGGEYEVLDVATHSETGERLVVYRCLYGDYGLWARPLTMFQETLNLEGREVKRFTLVTPAGGGSR